MTCRILIAAMLALTLQGCAGTPEGAALDNANRTLGTVNQTISSIRTIRTLTR